MKVFDALVYNDDRNAGNILYDQDWNLWMIDHTRTFSGITRLPEPLQVKYCEKGLWDKLQSLDEKLVSEQLINVVGKPEMKALFRRRDKLMIQYQALITHGKAQV